MLNTEHANVDEILLVDDHPIVRFGLMALLRQADDSLHFHEAEDAAGALAATAVHRPAVALVDLSLAGKISLELLRDLRAVAPTMGILVVSMHDERLYAERVLRAGARGYVMKQIAAKSIASAVKTVRNGGIWLSDEIRAELAMRAGLPATPHAGPNHFHHLSDREMDIFRLIGLGMKKGDIARELNVSPHTVETHRGNIKQKLGVASGAELYRLAFIHFQDEAAHR
jgi:DNA-binding NarL/FixJ family response regulator